MVIVIKKMFECIRMTINQNWLKKSLEVSTSQAAL